MKLIRFQTMLGLLLAAMICGCQSRPRAELLTLDNQPLDPFELRDVEVRVFIFTQPDCPISNRYAPTVRTLHDEFRQQGVEFWLVYADPSVSTAMIREHVEHFQYPFGILRDPEHELVRLTGAKVTPEAVVFADQRMVYRGRIDDRFVDFGKTRPAPTTHDLREAIEAALARKPVANAVTAVVGCPIPEFR